MTVLLVASSGGHLAELHRLAPRLGVGEDRLWVTFDTPQSRALLAGEPTRFVPFSGPRQGWRALTNVGVAEQVIRHVRPSAVISTGAAIAFSFLPVARAHRIPGHYVESAARSEGPSLTGKMMALTPGVRLYTQYPGWAHGRWSYGGSVFDDFAPAPQRRAGEVQRVLVTLGTMTFGFRRLVDRLLAILPPEADVTWQTGVTDLAGLHIDGREALPPAEMRAAAEAADVIVAHAGVGSALDALELGRCPLLIPRRHAHDEHVDDHQALIAAELERRELAVVREADEVTFDDLVRAAGRSTTPHAAAHPFALK